MKIAKQRIVAGWFACLNTSHASQSTLEGLKLCGLRQEKAFRHLDSSILIASASWVNMASLIPDHGHGLIGSSSPQRNPCTPRCFYHDCIKYRRDCDHFFGTPPRGSTSHHSSSGFFEGKKIYQPQKITGEPYDFGIQIFGCPKKLVNIFLRN